jgi:hypothetical protein
MCSTKQNSTSSNEIAAKLIQPYVTFLMERLGTESEILHIIARYTQRFEVVPPNRAVQQKTRPVRRADLVLDVEQGRPS